MGGFPASSLHPLFFLPALPGGLFIPTSWFRLSWCPRIFVVMLVEAPVWASQSSLVVIVSGDYRLDPICIIDQEPPTDRQSFGDSSWVRGMEWVPNLFRFPLLVGGSVIFVL